MAGQISTLVTAIRAAMAATFTDLKPDGIWVYEQLDMIPWADLTPPYGAIVVSEWTKASRGGANFAMSAEIDLLRLRSVTGNDDLMTLADEMESLWRYLIDHRLPNVDTIGFSRLGWGNDIMGDEVLADKNYRYRAGRLTIEVLLGYNP